MHLFYHPDLGKDLFTLSVEESRHCAKALRKSAGETIFVTDGLGHLVKGSLIEQNSTGCTVQVIDHMEPADLRAKTLHLCVAPTKNPDRMEWLVEKCVEIGIEKISFVLCDHSERTHIDLKRMERIAIAAIKQSQTTLLPSLETIPLNTLLEQLTDKPADKLIAWCDPENNRQLMHYVPTENYILLLIGPEGDFSPEEVNKCRQLGFQEIKLGNRRLRTETAALYGTIVLSEKVIK